MKVLVTGASSEISRAIVARRLGMGDEVWLTGSSRESIDEVLAAFSGKNVKGFVFDFAKIAEGEAALDRLLNDGLEAIVLCAFQKQPSIRPYAGFSFDEVSKFLRENIEGNAWLVHRALPVFQKRKFGRLVLISSLSVASGTSGYSLYCAAKGALEGLFKNIATDYASDGIYSNILRPGIIATKRNERLWKRTHFDEVIKKIIPTQTIGEPKHVASAIDPLLDRDSYMNGAIVEVGGGLPSIKPSGLST